MIPLSSQETVRFTPAYYAEQANAPVYLVAVPTLKQRYAFRRALTAEGVAYVTDEQLYLIIRQGIREVIEDNEHAALLELVDQFEAGLASGGKDGEPSIPDASMIEDMAKIERTLSQYYPPYLDAVAARDHWNNVAPIIAAQHFLRGWEGVDKAFETRGGLVTEACLSRLPERDVSAIGWKAIILLAPNREQEKN